MDDAPALKVARYHATPEADAVEGALMRLVASKVEQRGVNRLGDNNDLLQILLPVGTAVGTQLLGKLAEKYIADSLIERTERAIVQRLKDDPIFIRDLTETSHEMMKARTRTGAATSIGIEVHPVHGRNAVVQVAEDDPARWALLLLLMAEQKERFHAFVGKRPRPPTPVAALPGRGELFLFDDETPDGSISMRLDEREQRLYFPLSYRVGDMLSSENTRWVRYYLDNGETREDQTVGSTFKVQP